TTVEDLKKEVKELKAASMAASETHSPIHSQLFHFNAGANESDAYINRLNCSGDDFSINRCQMDGQLTAPPVDSSVTTDDNEEFFDFTEGFDNNSETNHKKSDNSLDQLIQKFDTLLEDSSVNKKELYEQILETHSK
ncbi:unnamed protein product, partial [Medioppia subpectinata]